VDGVLATLEREPVLEPEWRSAMLGTASPLPYVAAREDLPGVDRIVHLGVGGVAFDALAPAWRDALRHRLADADALGVRDASTLAALRAVGLAPMSLPDPAVMVGALFGERLRARAGQGPVAAVASAFARGYVAVQLSAEFGDDATLAVAAGQLDALAARTGLGVVLFRAGAAPWHDDPAVLARLAARLPAHGVRLFNGLDLWDLCALIAHARAYAGSSLHGAIVASACGVAAAGLVRAGDHGQSAKLAAYLATWHAADDTRAWPVDRLAEGVETALATAPARRRDAADRRVAAYSTAFERLTACLD
jgi:hypothetical protein